MPVSVDDRGNHPAARDRLHAHILQVVLKFLGVVLHLFRLFHQFLHIAQPAEAAGHSTKSRHCSNSPLS
jgi:hypothetical protein